jgi:hypothetical protein
MVWSKKPWWCQPWSIALTGISLLSGLYFVFGLNWPLFVLGAPIVVVYPNVAK